MGRKVRYIGSFSVKTLHALFNRVTLRTLTRKYPGEVVCYASKSALPSLDVAGCAEVRKLPIYAGNGKPAVLLRYFLSAFHNIRILLSSRKGDILFYNTNNVFSLRLLDLINRRLKRDVVICCHSEMEYLLAKRGEGRLYKRVLTALVKNYFNPGSKPAPCMRFIVLGDIIKENLRPFLSDEMYSRFISVDHPYEETPVAKSEERRAEWGEGNFSDKGILNVGTVGILNETKGSNIYLKVVSDLSEEKLPVRFHAIGHIQCDPKPFHEAGVEIPEVTNEPLPYAEFAERVGNLDFILFFYGRDKYRLTASGALLDAVRFRKPVIALRNDYFEYFFRKFGAVGYLVDSAKEMESLLRNSGSLRRDFNFEEIAQKLSNSSSNFHLTDTASETS